MESMSRFCFLAAPLALAVAGCETGDDRAASSSVSQPPRMSEPAGRVMAVDEPGMARGDAEAVIAQWPATPQKTAREVMAKYGEPDEVTPNQLVWHNNGPWEKTILYREEVPHRFPMPHTDLLEQSIPYEVPEDMADELAMYDGSVLLDRTKGRIAARCDKEEMNFLAINLAHDIAEGRRTVEEARDFYARTAMAFKEGQKHEYTQGLTFEPMSRNAVADPDQPARR